MPDVKVAIVTGASRGIGAAVAERLAADGMAVAVNFAHGADDAQSIVDKISAAGGTAMAAQADVSDPAAVTAMFDAVSAKFGGVDVLVNNAGLMKLAPVAETSDDLFDKHIAVNLKGVFNGMRAAAKGMRDGGSIISFSSSVVGLYQPTYAVYAATKAGVEAMTHILAKELGKRAINVNVIAPGPVATELFLGDKTDDQVAQVEKMIPMGRLGEPEDIARVVSFLASPDGKWVSGQVLRANGGVV